jgi:uncharacterized protein (TIGR02265 family)
MAPFFGGKDKCALVTAFFGRVSGGGVAARHAVLYASMGRDGRGNTKGGVLVSRLNHLRDRGGNALVERVIARLSAGDQAILRGLVLPSAWYPFDLNERLDGAIVEILGGGDATYRALGRQSASDNLATTHKNYTRQRDPHALFRQAASMYRVYYDTGTRTYEMLGPKKACVRTMASRSFSRTDCLTIVGYFERAAEICGGATVRVNETLCRARGQEVCEYVIEWE